MFYKCLFKNRKNIQLYTKQNVNICLPMLLLIVDIINRISILPVLNMLNHKCSNDIHNL